MLKVLGVWELGWNTPLIEFDLWAFPLRDYGVDEFTMTPVSGINKKVTEFKDIESALEANDDLIPVFVEEDGETLLEDFVHPENVIYVFGKASFSPWKARKKKGISVKIETISNNGLLWPHQCACIVLRDRILKENDCNNNREQNLS